MQSTFRPTLATSVMRHGSVFAALLLAALWIGLSTPNVQAQSVDWFKGESGPNVFASQMVTDENNNFYIFGGYYGTTFIGSTPLEGQSGRLTLFVAKYDAQGNNLWLQQVQGWDLNAGSLAIDDSGSVYISGEFQGALNFGTESLDNANPWLETFFAKYDTNGNFLWATPIRGIDNEEYPTGRPIATDSAGNLYITGRFAGTVWFGEQMYSAQDPNDIYIAKYDTNGNFVWVTQISDNTDEWVSAIAYHDDRVYIAGVYYATAAFGSTPITSAGAQDIFVAAFSGNGTPLWARGAGGPASDLVANITTAVSGNIYLSGRFEGSAAFGPITLTSTGANGAEDGFLAKYDDTGTPLWVTNFGTTGSEGASAVVLDSADNPYVMGRAGTGTLIFGTISLHSYNQRVFIARYDPQGSPIWVTQATSFENISTGSIALAGENSLYMLGGFTTQAELGPFEITRDGPNHKLFLARLNTLPATDVIFRDGFEGGGFSAWTNYSSDFGDLSVTPAARIFGNLGLEARLDDEIPIGMRDEMPERENSYRARFYFDPNSLAMAQGESHVIFFGYSGDDLRRPVLRLELHKRNNAFQLRAALFDDGTTWRVSEWIDVSDQPHRFEVAWIAASSSGENNGKLNLWFESGIKYTIGGVDNDTRRIDTTRLGAIAGIDPGTRGAYFFDAFESRRYSFIGVEPNAATAIDQPAIDQPDSTAETEVAVAWTDHDESEPEEAALMQEVLEYAEQVEREEAQAETPPSEEEQSPQLFIPYVSDH